MNRHLLRLIWNRKRHNLLIALEIFFSFLVVLAISAAGVNLLVNWFKPLGYRIDRVWRIEMNAPEESEAPSGEAPSRTAIAAREIFATLRSMPGIEAVAGLSIAPYSSSDWNRGSSEISLQMAANAATDDLAEVMGLEVTDGRWFSREDDASGDVRPVVVNQQLARQLFGDERPIGKILPIPRRPDSQGRRPPEERVVGVITDFRKGGELSTSRNYIFSRIVLDRIGRPYSPFPSAVVVRVQPGTTADFEETILSALQPIARDWVFTVRSLEADREDSFNTYSVAFGIAGILAGFLLLMVALGLTGVVWQMVTERTREFGLRRAKGAAAVNVQRQVLTELFLIASLAVVPGALLAAQIPALPKPSDWVIPDGVFLASVALSVMTIYLVVLVCGWYPSRLATKIHPAEALHYE
jgi:putative ABC transport system permease protein